MYTSRANVDRVWSLPFAPSLKSNHFSGYLEIDAKKRMHYVYIESENDPSTDSLILWTNGGPGCSGMLGLFTELGPWRPQSDGTLLYNPMAWTRLASMLFIEQPIGVGFSYSTDRKIPPSGDFQASRDNLIAIQEFLKRFPERMNNTFYLSSESYGGHYIPQLALAILHSEDNRLKAQFKGFLIGNPFTNFGSGSVAMAHALWGHQVISGKTWKTFLENKCENMVRSSWTYPSACWKLLSTIHKQSNTLNPYSLTFPTCVPASGRFHSSQANQRLKASRIMIDRMLALQETALGGVDDLPDVFVPSFAPRTSLSTAEDKLDSENGLPYDPCTEDYTVAYLSSSAVQQALHVTDSRVTTWSVCSDPIFDTWPTLDENADTTPLFGQIILHSEKSDPFRMLIYSGDADGVCATVGTQDWIYSVPGADAFNDSFVLGWEAWNTPDQQLGGFRVNFNNSFVFATVRNAGHEVPAYQPARAFILLSSFLNGSLFLRENDGVLDSMEATPSSQDPLGISEVFSFALFAMLAFSCLALSFAVFIRLKN